MPLSLGHIFALCIAIYVLTILIEVFFRRDWRRFFFQACVISGIVLLGLAMNHASTGRVTAFGPDAAVRTVLVMFGAAVLGIVARYIFYLEKGQFSILDFAKPIVISPIVLLPLIASLQTTGELTGMQFVSFGLLAFQNGFFWQAVLAGREEHARKSE
jgi:hypothetical protein